MSEHATENAAACPVPECSNGYVRVPLVVERINYGSTEKFVRFDDFQCDECGGLGRVPTRVIPPTHPAPTDHGTDRADEEGGYDGTDFQVEFDSTHPKPVIVLLREIRDSEHVPTYLRASADQVLVEIYGIEDES